MKRDDHEPIPAEDAEVFVGNDETLIIEFAFSKADAITLEDTEVEFISKVGEMEVKRKFRLDEMMFGDQLAL